MLAWTDTTNYSRGQERKPSCWTADVGPFRLVVLNSHRAYPGQWVMHVYPGLIDTALMPLEPSATPEMAFLKAEQTLRQTLFDTLKVLGGVDMV